MMQFYHWLGADAEAAAAQEETRRQLAREALVIEEPDHDE